jgi:hypothetical protein
MLPSAQFNLQDEGSIIVWHFGAYKQNFGHHVPEDFDLN